MPISGFRSKVDEICALLVYNAAYSDKTFPKFRDELSLPFSMFKKSKKRYLTDRLSRKVSKGLPLYIA